MLAFLGDSRPQKSRSNLERTTSQRGEAAMTAGRVEKSAAENENRSPGTYLNPLNRPVRTRMPGGVAGDAEDYPPRPYADFKPSVRCRVLPSRPEEFRPEPLTDPDLILSHHPARVIARRLPPSAETSCSSRFDPVGPTQRR